MLSFIVQHACNIIMIIVPACDYGNAEKISDPYKTLVQLCLSRVLLMYLPTLCSPGPNIWTPPLGHYIYGPPCMQSITVGWVLG